ncbi:conserved hypothetical protein [Rippkaea orientalis PCC 8801]|uniref:Uncharacterized protein n=1 Tax=Rippkaea orientalis (strain PCC 8801 / RF-1) TaxID=41431 RepID=B7JYV1_RIPO1|nr:hypothetical protein [Rippkaea orientalis]ACK66028.1 conserved hypothetical protein [Rippkaea orientalis PCC 8801]
MARLNPHTLQMQISRMFDQGQSFFCTMKVQDWLKERNEDPNAYDIIFHPQPAPPNSPTRTLINIELRRRDGQTVDPWLQEEVNRHS